MIQDPNMDRHIQRIEALEKNVAGIHKWMELTNQQITLLQDQIIILKKLIDLPL